MGLSGLSGNSGLGGIVPGGIPWIPTMEPSLRLWIDPSDTTGWTLDGSGNPTAIRSKAATQDVFTLVGGTAPVLNVGALVVTGAANSFSVSSRLGFPENIAPAFVAGVISNSAASTNPALAIIGFTTAAPAVTTTTSIVGWSSSTAGTATFSHSMNQEEFVFSLTRETPNDRVSDKASINGGAVASASTVPTTAFNNSAATRLWPGGWQGTCKDLLIFASTSPELVERAEGYLAHKHNRTAQFPSNHPFKFSPP
jgi:hypothetical protein